MALDSITLDMFWNRLIATTNDQAAALMRSSFTSIVRDSGDLSAAVFDRRGRMVAQAVTGTPGHINSMATGMTHFLTEYPVDTLKPGDVLITNDPWKTASQLNDISIATPVFHNGQCVALFASCCHALDIGGRGLSADSRSVHEEGLYIPIMKLFDQGEAVQPLFSLLASNVRMPDEVLGDIHSQVVGNEAGARQLLAFLNEFDLDDIEDVSDMIIQRSETAMRQRIHDLQDGTYRYELTIDGFDEPLTLKTAITVEGDMLTVNYAGSPGQVNLGINVALNYTVAYTTYGVKCAIGGDIPNNAGSFIPIAITAPPGTLLNARYPAAVAGRHLVGHFLPSLIMGALADVLPENVMAPGFDGLWDTHISGFDPHHDEHFSYTWFSAGGAGALFDTDGLSTTAYPSGIAGVPVEIIESLAPIIVHNRSLCMDSGGPGQFRGGLGQSMTLEVMTNKPFVFSGLYERIKFPAPGLHGGHPGMPGRVSDQKGNALAGKFSHTLPSDTMINLELPGGGGYGHPHMRDPERVLIDVIEGLVSMQQALESYRVTINPLDMSIDWKSTKKLREEHSRN